MVEASPGDVCPETGIWSPSNNWNFYPADYAEKVMRRTFNEGEVMPRTPHDEPSWILMEQRKPIENFTGLSPKEIAEKVKSTGKK